MSKIFCKNTATGLIPLYDSDYEEKRKLKIGEVYECEIKRKRNYDFHKKFFALIKLGCENSPLGMPEQAYRAYVTMKAGYAEVYKTPTGRMALPQSISFSSMDQPKFEKLFFAVLQIIAKDIGSDQETIQSELINFM
jgi:hypothetical protein